MSNQYVVHLPPAPDLPLPHIVAFTIAAESRVEAEAFVQGIIAPPEANGTSISDEMEAAELERCFPPDAEDAPSEP